eukprot:scaffold322604_cov27-Tisochrysis_lutea.AAC.1
MALQHCGEQFAMGEIGDNKRIREPPRGTRRERGSESREKASGAALSVGVWPALSYQSGGRSRWNEMDLSRTRAGRAAASYHSSSARLWRAP